LVVYDGYELGFYRIQLFAECRELLLDLSGLLLFGGWPEG
jgi:hypothetical protein